MIEINAKINLQFWNKSELADKFVKSLSFKLEKAIIFPPLPSRSLALLGSR
jgi:hypothetical protein